MNVSGHRISTTEVESALVSHPSVAEAAVVGKDRSSITGWRSSCRDPRRFRRSNSSRLEAVREHVAEMIEEIRAAQADPVHPGPAEDALRQDHAPPAS